MQTGIASVTFETQTNAETSLALYAMDMAIDANDGNPGANPIADELRKAQRTKRTKEGNLSFTISPMAMLQISIGFELLGELQEEMPSLDADEADALVAILAHNKRVGALKAEMDELNGSGAGALMREFHRND